MAEKYLVIYYDDGKDEDGKQRFTIHACPCKSEKECMDQLNKVIASKFGKRVRDYDIIDSEPILQIKKELPTTGEIQKIIDRASNVPEKKPKTDYSKMSKAELKDILKQRGVKTLYHDTMDILRQKCIDSEG